MTTASTLPTSLRGRSRVAGLPVSSLATPSPVTTLLRDVFTGADTTNLTAHTMDVGAGWTAVAGTMTIVGNAAVCQSATTHYACEAGRSDKTIVCDFKCGAANANLAPNIVFREYDTNNYVSAYFSGDGNFTITRRMNATYATVGSAAWVADTNWHTAIIIDEDTHVTVYLDGVLLFEGYITDYAGCTKVGLLGFVSTQKDSFDNFSVTGKVVEPLSGFPNINLINSFTDPFTGADTTRLNTFGWTEHAGQWQISSNKATQTLNSSPTNGYVVSRNCGYSDIGLEIKITTPATSGFICGLVFRLIDLNHYVEAELNTNATQGGFALWYTDNSGAYVQIARQNRYAFVPANNTTYTMRVLAKGSLVMAQLTASGVDLRIRGWCNQFLNATRVGLFENRSAGTYPNANLYDDFKVYVP